MKSKDTANALGQSQSTNLVGAFAIALGLATAGYAMGFTETAARFVQAPAEATAAATSERAAINSAAPLALRYELPTASASMQVFAYRDGIAGPRECAVDEGVTERCTFN